jgi:hypothetical protein
MYAYYLYLQGALELQAAAGCYGISIFVFRFDRTKHSVIKPPTEVTGHINITWEEVPAGYTERSKPSGVRIYLAL